MKGRGGETMTGTHRHTPSESTQNTNQDERDRDRERPGFPLLKQRTDTFHRVLCTWPNRGRGISGESVLEETRSGDALSDMERQKNKCIERWREREREREETGDDKREKERGDRTERD